MKILKIFSSVILVLTILTAYCRPLIQTSEKISDDVFRLHILANSDSDEDQKLKLSVRDYILENCNYFNNCSTVEEAIHCAQNNIDEIEQLANACIRAQGYTYTATARVVREYFSTRVYETITLPAGYYNSLKIEIGQGAGHNWWCIIFPSVCLSACTDDDLSAYLDDDEMKLIESDSEYAVKFKTIEIYEKLKEKFSEKY